MTLESIRNSCDVCRDRLPQLNITFDLEDNIELTQQKVRKRSDTGILEEDNGGRESEQKNDGDNFGEGGGGGGGEVEGGEGGVEKEGQGHQGNKMARSFMRQANYLPKMLSCQFYRI